MKAATFATMSASFDAQDGNECGLHFWNPEQDCLDAVAASHRLFAPSAAIPSSPLGLGQMSNAAATVQDGFLSPVFSNQADTPAFPDDASCWSQRDPMASSRLAHDVGAEKYPETYPLTPSLTASLDVTPRHGSREPASLPFVDYVSRSFSPPMTQKPTGLAPCTMSPCHSGSSNSQTGGADNVASMSVQQLACLSHKSPRVTVSEYKDDSTPGQFVERTLGFGCQTAHDICSSLEFQPVLNRRHSLKDCDWHNKTATRRRGPDSRSRSAEETISINQVTAQRKLQDQIDLVDKWVTKNNANASTPQETTDVDMDAMEQARCVADDGVPLGNATENRYVAGRTYYNQNGGSGGLNDVDRQIMAGDLWGDAPVIHQILPSTNQPPTSQAAIDKFELLWRDNDSTISRSATWGTRRRSHPSILDADVEGVVSGNFLKKLILSGRGSAEKSSRSGGLLSELRGLVRRPSASSLRKRSRSRSHSAKGEKEAQPEGFDMPAGKPHLSPPTRTPSWSKKAAPTRSINSALVSMGHVSAAIGATHSRSASISSRTLGSSLSIRNALGRSRSVSAAASTEIGSNVVSLSAESHPDVVNLSRQSREPPMAQAIAPLPQASADEDDEDDEDYNGGGEDDDDDADDDDDDDELHRDGSIRVTDASVMDKVTPDTAGFRQHIISLNAKLAKENGYLADRIAHQQTLRYSWLVKAKNQHSSLGATCPCGPLCLGSGPHAARPQLDKEIQAPPSDGDDWGDLGEGVISQESFPPGIPMPPTRRFPAELECQLCFQRKKCYKPSDWTKHVYEDVQPYTCTWDQCREAKMFKRKADWARHENEGHRHLEWWTCDIDLCRHICYRRDNFLQHLVREHKFTEPRVKTKAALKRIGVPDPTWAKVEQCHQETSKQPQQEACRFCNSVFSTWKDLIVHLAKHMEQIALPVLHLVAEQTRQANPESSLDLTEGPEGLQPRGILGAVSQGQGLDGHASRPYQPADAQHFDCHVGLEQQIMSMMLSSEQQQYAQQMPAFALSYGAVEVDAIPVAGFRENDVEPFPLFDELGLESFDASPMDGQQIMGMGPSMRPTGTGPH